ncbi:MAG: copper homeostasis protein CutC [Flavobacteriaceae bacterium]|nr:copper homeostasis protein CutC [Flavobacteriaceae bacterium]
MILEICAHTFESALAAQEAGGHQIELCENLSVGGITPSRGLIDRVMEALEIPIHVLIRPRNGDFCYSEMELKTMLRDIEYCKSIGASGIVCGALTSKFEVDKHATQMLLSASKGMEFTFHRAFDQTLDPQQAFEILMHLGVTRLLSSGQQQTAVAGMPLLKWLLNHSEEKIQIMPGGGISAKNALQFQAAGFRMIHTSATKKKKKTGNDLFNQQIVGHSDPEEIRRILFALS